VKTVPAKQRPTVVQALAITALGTVIAVYGLGGAAPAMAGGGEAPPLGAMIALCAGALLFSIGAMLLLVAIVRPLFGKRPQDEVTQQHMGPLA
jgi:hypothetical protein